MFITAKKIRLSGSETVLNLKPTLKNKLVFVNDIFGGKFLMGIVSCIQLYLQHHSHVRGKSFFLILLPNVRALMVWKRQKGALCFYAQHVNGPALPVILGLVSQLPG